MEDPPEQERTPLAHQRASNSKSCRFTNPQHNTTSVSNIGSRCSAFAMLFDKGLFKELSGKGRWGAHPALRAGTAQSWRGASPTLRSQAKACCGCIPHTGRKEIPAERASGLPARKAGNQVLALQWISVIIVDSPILHLSCPRGVDVGRMCGRRREANRNPSDHAALTTLSDCKSQAQAF